MITDRIGLLSVPSPLLICISVEKKTMQSRIFFRIRGSTEFEMFVTLFTSMSLLFHLTTHSTRYLFSDWPKECSEISKSAPRTSSNCR